MSQLLDFHTKKMTHNISIEQKNILSVNFINIYICLFSWYGITLATTKANSM